MHYRTEKGYKPFDIEILTSECHNHNTNNIVCYTIYCTNTIDTDISQQVYRKYVRSVYETWKNK